MTETTIADQVHGTYASYQRELKTTGKPCDRCKRAAADWHREWRKRGSRAVAHERWLVDTHRQALGRMAREYPAEFLAVLDAVRAENPEEPA
jgi:hypothetical protein